MKSLFRTFLVALAVVFVLPLGGCANIGTFQKDALKLHSSPPITHTILHKEHVHVVKRGESLSSIADNYKVSIYQTANMNDLRPPYTIYVGQALKIPLPNWTNVISRFKTLNALREQELITEHDYNTRRQANIGALLPLTSSPPAAGLDQWVPATEMILGRLREIRRGLDKRTITVSQHAAERSMILDALLPATPVSLAVPSNPPQDWDQAAERANKLDQLIEKNLINKNEYNLEGEAIEAAIPPIFTVISPKQVFPKTSLQPSSTITQANDTTPPSIQIASSLTVNEDSPTISGKVTDANKVVQITVNGVASKFSGNTFSFTLYVPISGTTVQIEAIDEWGNKSSKTVKLTRTITDTSDQQSFASLNPTKINGQSNRNAVALVIGIADYTRAPAAVYADSDANVFSDYARRALGISQSNIKVLTNTGASRTDLQVAIKRWLRGRIEKGKTDVYVFYAGHGLASPDGNDLYLLPYNGEPSLLEETSIQRTELFDVIAAASPKSATVFLDTCYSGLSRGEETLLASARPILIKPKQQTAPKGFTVFSAASGGQISSGLDEAKHGLFSYYLMKGMEGDADGNKDRAITAGELHAYVLKNVKSQAIRLGREQVPELQGDAERVLVRW